MKRSWWVASVIGVLVVAVAVVLVVRGTAKDSDTGPAPGSSESAAPEHRSVLAVKIDNVLAARPQTGLAEADLIYVEPVEGGLTRLLALYWHRPPSVIGPVRSARATDLGLLAQYGKTTLAYSGAAPELLPSLHTPSLVNASPSEVANAYSRDETRPDPHNLFLRPEKLPGSEPVTAGSLPESGPAPGPGVAASTASIRFPAAAFDFTWSPERNRWLIVLDGEPLTSGGTARVEAATVVEQRVPVQVGERGESGTVPNSPVAQTTGTGQATVWREGQRFPATWERPDPRSPTRFRTTAGQPLPPADGPLWILLVPA